MLDFNSAEVQTEGTGSAIPEDSIIPFLMTIRPPKAGKEGTTHHLFSKSAKGNEYIDVEFEAQGTFAGRKVWQNFTLVGSDQAAKISMRTLRAIVESARGIAPSDASPAASAGRQLSDWADFNGLVFLAKVKCVVEQNQKDGNYYVNNEFKKIITADDTEYAAGEFISDKPLPSIPEAGAPKQTTAAAATGGAWGAPPSGVPAATTTPPAAQKTTSPVPAWATR
jgi:hypothetical protein